jgi:hypothetical protein
MRYAAVQTAQLFGLGRFAPGANGHTVMLPLPVWRGQSSENYEHLFFKNID